MMAEPNSPVLGLHLEGHYFNMDMAGGQIPENIKDPDPEEYIPLLEETRCIKRWDAAPELPGAMQFGKYITAKGVLASVGHTRQNLRIYRRLMRRDIRMLLIFITRCPVSINGKSTSMKVR